jgi:hypothetical protein
MSPALARCCGNSAACGSHAVPTAAATLSKRVVAEQRDDEPEPERGGDDGEDERRGRAVAHGANYLSPATIEVVTCLQTWDDRA